MSSFDSPRTRLSAWLRERADAVRECEQKASVALHDEGNEPAYRDLMRQKARLLAAIADDAAPLVNALPGKEREAPLGSLEAFSQNARTALRLDSVFYMSALLYPDDHQEGDPNNLEKLIASLG